MIFEQLVPAPFDSIDGDDRERLLKLYRPPTAEWLRLNLITSVTGAASGSDGTSETLSNPADRRILGVIRELADVVLIGAQSVRAEGYQQPKRSRIAIVTTTGNLDGHRLERGNGPAPIIVCPPSSEARVRESIADAEVLAVDDEAGRIPPTAIMRALRGIGLASVVCEGGPGLAAQLVDAGLVQEFCLATSPRIGGAPFPVLGGSTVAERRVQLTSLLRDESSGLYARWAVVD